MKEFIKTEDIYNHYLHQMDEMEARVSMFFTAVHEIMYFVAPLCDFLILAECCKNPDDYYKNLYANCPTLRKYLYLNFVLTKKEEEIKYEILLSMIIEIKNHFIKFYKSSKLSSFV